MAAGMSVIRIGIVGAGQIARTRHLPGFHALPGVKVVGVCNLHRESTSRISREYDIPKVFGSWEDLVEDDNDILIRLEFAESSRKANLRKSIARILHENGIKNIEVILRAKTVSLTKAKRTLGSSRLNARFISRSSGSSATQGGHSTAQMFTTMRRAGTRGGGGARP